MQLAGVVTSRMLQTNATVLTDEHGTVVVDAPYFPDELEALHALVPAGGPLALLATHSHFDHLLGRLAFPHAPLHVGRATAQRIADDADEPSRDLYDSDVRVYLAERPLSLAPLAPAGDLAGRVTFVETPGHAPDGIAVVAEDVVCVGDYLSDVEIPLVSAAGSLEDYVATLERLRDVVGEAPLVVCGHGSPCDGAAARARLEEDLRYLERLRDGDPDQPLPHGRDTPRQREIHRANIERHVPSA